MALNILTERTSLPLCSFQGSRRRTGTVRAVAAQGPKGPVAAICRRSSAGLCVLEEAAEGDERRAQQPHEDAVGRGP